MTDSNKHDWGKRKNTLISILEDTITLLDDISHSFQNDYPQTRISHFRYLCFGYILISRDNIRTSLLLLRNNMIYQVHNYCRNMFEMVVNLTYINDDKSEMEKKLKRFFDYKYVQEYNLLDTLKQYPTIVPELKKENKDSIIQENYNHYILHYNIKKKVVTDWSGLSLYKMMKNISDEKKRDDLLKGYLMFNRINNQYVHPSIEFIGRIIEEEYQNDVNDDYKNQILVSLLESIYVSVFLIIEIYLDHFQKNRQTFRNKCNELETRFKNMSLNVVNT